MHFLKLAVDVAAHLMWTVLDGVDSRPLQGQGVGDAVELLLPGDLATMHRWSKE